VIFAKLLSSVVTKGYYTTSQTQREPKLVYH